MIKAMFGYKIVNGAPVIDEKQAAALRQVAERYIGGASLKSEAERLRAMKLAYAPGKWDWNKNRIQRLLTNRTYLGDENYAPLIDGDTFEKIQTIMQSRNTQKGYNRQTVFSSAVAPILCGKCGQPVERKYDARWKIPTRYTCTGHDCGKIYRIPDSALWSEVKELLQETGESEQEPNQDTQMELYRLNNEIEHGLQSPDMESAVIQAKILEYAALQYRSLHLPKRERMEFQERNPCSPILIQEIRRRISAVLLDEENIRIRLTDGRTVGKENRQDGTDHGKEGHGHPADSHPAE